MRRFLVSPYPLPQTFVPSPIVLYALRIEQGTDDLPNFSVLSNSEKGVDVELGGVATLACVTLLWRAGDKLHSAKKYGEAAEWYLLGTHALFRRSHSHLSSDSNQLLVSGMQMSQTKRSMDIGNKCLRKAALCYIEMGEYARASVVVRRCGGNEAASWYVRFLCGVYQGLEDEGGFLMFWVFL